MTGEETLDEGRRAIAARSLTPIAVTHMTRDALGTIAFAALAPVKKLLKRYFSDEAWTGEDARSLGDLVGPGEGWWRYDLADDITLEFGWREGTFRIESVAGRGLGATFDTPVVPEATPNPRSIRFVTGAIHGGPSRWYEHAGQADDARVARLFADFPEVANVLVGPDFVAVGLQHADAWERLLEPVLRVVATEFANGGGPPVTETPRVESGDRRGTRSSSPSTPPTALENAWRELSVRHAEDPDDQQVIVVASQSADAAHRQVAARLLIEADAGTAAREWERLLADPSRGVRRATVDAMVDAERPALRALLERALLDTDAWTRWKALRGLVGLGIGPSRAVAAPLTGDPDFRVRLEAAGALRVRD